MTHASVALTRHNTDGENVSWTYFVLSFAVLVGLAGYAIIDFAFRNRPEAKGRNGVMRNKGGKDQGVVP